MTASAPTAPRASASFPFAAPFLPLATEFVDKAAAAFGFGQREIAGLTLAVEEIYSCYLEQLAGIASIDLALTDERYQLRLDLRFRMAHPKLQAFNLTYRVDPDDEGSLAGLGLMIAARSVTRLSIELGSDEQVGLQLIREREYPPATAQPLPAAPVSAALALAVPRREDLVYFGSLLAADRAALLPAFLERPAMAADMLAGGALGALLASAGQTLVGGVFWRRLSESTIELYGPYLLFPDSDDALLTRLLDEAVGRISRSGARALLRRQGALPGYERFFDFLGELELASPSAPGETLVWPHYYKQLREESGGVVYAEPRFAEFLRAEYDRLFLPRQLARNERGGRRRRRFGAQRRLRAAPFAGDAAPAGERRRPRRQSGGASGAAGARERRQRAGRDRLRARRRDRFRRGALRRRFPPALVDPRRRTRRPRRLRAVSA